MARRVNRRTLPISCTLRKDQIEHMDAVTHGTRGERSRWIRDAVDRKIWEEEKLLKEMNAQADASQSVPE